MSRQHLIDLYVDTELPRETVIVGGPGGFAWTRADHGSLGAYKRGCRCRQCKDANNAYARQRRAEDIEAYRAYNRVHQRLYKARRRTMSVPPDRTMVT